MRVAFGSFTANAWGSRFLRQFAVELPTTPEDRRRILVRTRGAAQQFLREKRGTLPDRKARLIYGLCSLVLAGYREVLALTGDPARAVEAVRAAYLRTHQAPARLMTRAFLRLASEPAKVLSWLPLAWYARRMYGSAMEFGQEKTEEGIDLIVSRCAFHQFFVEHGEPSLTRIFCGWDRNWMDVVEASDRPMRVERPSTLSTGGMCCRFSFIRDTEKGLGPSIDIVLAARPGRSDA